MSCGLKRVVITGIGAVTPAGNTVQDLWSSIVQGKSGIDKITRFDATEYTAKIAGEIKNLDLKDHFNSKELRKTDRVSQWALISTKEAMKDSGLVLDQLDAHRFGVIFGSGIGGIETMENQYSVLQARGPRKISPFFIPMEIIDMTAGLISMEYQAKGPNFCIVSACATGAHCIGESARIIATGDADIIITGASEAAVTPLGIGGFASLKALSTNNDNPQGASRPFDLNRDGFVLSEGSATLVLEEYEHAKKRGAKIYGELVGYGLTGDAFHMTQPAPDGEGGARAIQMAIDKSGIEASKVDYYNAHGTSTKYNDAFETSAVKTVFGDHAYKMPVSSTKAITGHMLAAAGAVEMIIVLKAMEESIVPPTWNYETPDPDCDLDYVPNEPREATLNVCMSNSLGFGGHNASLMVQKV